MRIQAFLLLALAFFSSGAAGARDCTSLRFQLENAIRAEERETRELQEVERQYQAVDQQIARLRSAEHRIREIERELEEIPRRIADLRAEIPRQRQNLLNQWRQRPLDGKPADWSIEQIEAFVSQLRRDGLKRIYEEYTVGIPARIEALRRSVPQLERELGHLRRLGNGDGDFRRELHRLDRRRMELAEDVRREQERKLETITLVAGLRTQLLICESDPTTPPPPPTDGFTPPAGLKTAEFEIVPTRRTGGSLIEIEFDSRYPVAAIEILPAIASVQVRNAFVTTEMGPEQVRTLLTNGPVRTVVGQNLVPAVAISELKLVVEGYERDDVLFKVRVHFANAQDIPREVAIQGGVRSSVIARP